jgi:hypothetical protein
MPRGTQWLHNQSWTPKNRELRSGPDKYFSFPSNTRLYVSRVCTCGHAGLGVPVNAEGGIFTVSLSANVSYYACHTT